MSKFIKTLLAITTGAVLMSASISVASATQATNLTYAQFTQTDGYKQFLAKSELGAEYLANQSGVEMVVDMTMTSDHVTQPLANISVSATKTQSKTDMTVDGKTLTVYYTDGHAYSTMSSYRGLAGPANLSKVLTRLPGNANKTVKMADMPEALAPFDPSEIFSPSSDTYNKLLNSEFKDLLNMFQFSEVTISTNPTNETYTDYEWDMGFSLFGTSSNVHSKYTLDANSSVLVGSVNANVTAGTTSVETATRITMTINNALVIDVPDLSSTIDEAQITRMSHKITAEGKSTSKANAIVKRAKEQAKKTRAKLSGKHLRDAAKALKYTVSNITNGVRLTATVSNVKGSLCVVAGGGLATIKTC
jgi:hypothetical protein